LFLFVDEANEISLAVQEGKLFPL